MSTSSLKVIPLRPHQVAPSKEQGEIITPGNPYQLLFEGPKDSSPETLRRLKGSLLTDLKLSVDEARRILECAPATVKSGSSEDELKPYLDMLNRSGAKVTIVSNSPDAPLSAKARVETITEEFEIDTSMLLDEEEEKNQFLFSAEDELAAGEDDPDINDEVEKLIKGLSAGETPELIGTNKAPATDIIELTETAPPLSLNAPKNSIEEQAIVPLEGKEVSPLQFELEENKSERRGALYFMELEMSQPPPTAVEQPQSIKVMTVPPVGASFENPNAPDTDVASEPVQPPKHTHPPHPVKNAQGRGLTFGLPQETMLSLVLSVLVLFLGNWFYFSSNQGVADINLLQALLSMPNYEGEESVSKEPEDVEPSSFSAHNEYSDNFVDSKFNLIGTKVKSFTILFTTPPTPELSALEIVYHKERAPWLRKVEINSEEISYLEDGSFVAPVTGKAYIEHKNTRIRLPAEVTLRGVYDPKTKVINAKLKIKIGDADSTSEVPLVSLASGHYRFATSAELKFDGSSATLAQ